MLFLAAAVLFCGLGAWHTNAAGMCCLHSFLAFLSYPACPFILPQVAPDTYLTTEPFMDAIKETLDNEYGWGSKA